MKRLALIAAVPLAACGSPDGRSTTTTNSVASEATPALRPATSRQIRNQDRSGTRQQRYEDRAAELHPLLTHLPMAVGGVEIAVAGLSADRTRIRLLLTPRHATKAHARAVYRDVLWAYQDAGHGYTVRVAR